MSKTPFLIHCCAHFGDIEIEEAGDNQALIKFHRLTPMEREALDGYLESVHMSRSGEEGRILVPEGVVQAGAALNWHMHENDTLITAVRFSTGEVKASRKPILSWLRQLVCGAPPEIDADAPPEEAPVETAPPPPPEPEAAVQVPEPVRGCPMPDYTELRESKAAEVTRKFLTGQQVEDFDRHRSFLVEGCDTGRLYQVTSRWNPTVGRRGVLRDLTRDRSICAQNKRMPPSEECLSMKFAVELFEKEFLNRPG